MNATRPTRAVHRPSGTSRLLHLRLSSSAQLTIKQLSAVDLSSLELDGDDVSKRLVQELDGRAEVGHLYESAKGEAVGGGAVLMSLKGDSAGK